MRPQPTPPLPQHTSPPLPTPAHPFRSTWKGTFTLRVTHSMPSTASTSFSQAVVVCSSPDEVAACSSPEVAALVIVLLLVCCWMHQSYLSFDTAGVLSCSKWRTCSKWSTCSKCGSYVYSRVPRTALPHYIDNSHYSSLPLDTLPPFRLSTKLTCKALLPLLYYCTSVLLYYCTTLPNLHAKHYFHYFSPPHPPQTTSGSVQATSTKSHSRTPSLQVCILSCTRQPLHWFAPG